MISSGHWLTWLREARASVRKNDNRWRGIMMTSFEPWIPQRVTDALYRAFVGKPAETQFCFVRAPLAEEARRSAARIGSILSGDLATDRLRWMQRSDTAVHGKGMLALTKVELRDPTADRGLVEFCLSLPMDQLIRDGVYRPLARRALADRVPEAILNLPTRGFQGADWYARLRRADALNILDEIATSHTASELLDVAKMRQAIDNWPSPERSGYATVFTFGRTLTDALASGKFIADIERNASAFRF
jgi:asparagine synthase (glutamine-hydrolysing)